MDKLFGKAPTVKGEIQLYLSLLAIFLHLHYSVKYFCPSKRTLSLPPLRAIEGQRQVSEEGEQGCGERQEVAGVTGPL